MEGKKVHSENPGNKSKILQLQKKKKNPLKFCLSKTLNET